MGKLYGCVTPPSTEGLLTTTIALYNTIKS